MAGMPAFCFLEMKSDMRSLLLTQTKIYILSELKILLIKTQ